MIPSSPTADMGKTVTEQKKIGNKGVAYLEHLLTDHCLVHRIDEAKDIGCDLFCELLKGTSPTRLLFFIQVKTTKQEVRNETFKKPIENNNRLRSVQFKSPPSHLRIDKKTLDYWMGFEVPVYLFFVVLSKNGDNKCYYKRYTPILHGKTREDGEPFYEVIEDNVFLAFHDGSKEGIGGFVRDLFVDYIRCNYKKGSLAWRNPRDIGLLQFPEEAAVFEEVAKGYEKEILSTIGNLVNLGIFESLDSDTLKKVYPLSGFSGTVTDSFSHPVPSSACPPDQL